VLWMACGCLGFELDTCSDIQGVGDPKPNSKAMNGARVDR